MNKRKSTSELTVHFLTKQNFKKFNCLIVVEDGVKRGSVAVEKIFSTEMVVMLLPQLFVGKQGVGKLLKRFFQSFISHPGNIYPNSFL